MEFSVSNSVLIGEITNSTEQSFISTFKTAVKNNPTKIAILYRDDNGSEHPITYTRLDQLSGRMARLFQKCCNYNRSRDNIVAVSLKPTETLPVILLAIMRAGMSYLPIDLEFPADRVRHILQDAQPLMCIVEESVDTNVYKNVLLITQKRLISEAEVETDPVTNDDLKDISKIALILYTSGSTGIPKGVRVPYSAMLNRLAWQWKELPYNNDEVNCIFKTALTFVDSVCEIWGPLLQGRTLVVVQKHITKNPEKFMAILNQYKIHRLVLVPSLLKSMLMYLHLEQNKDSLSSLKLWICSGETLAASLVQDFFRWFAGANKIMANFYGSTEIMGDVTFYLIKEDDPYLKENRVPIGGPLDNCIIYVVDEHLHLVPQGAIGELLIAGRNLADGYIHDSNSHKFIDNPLSTKKEFMRAFRTGDYAKVENNQLFYEGRQDNQVKIRGHRVDLTEVQKAVLKSPLVEDSVVLSCINNSEQVLLSFVVPRDKNSNTQAKEIKSFLGQYLVSYMVPEVILIDSIPLLVNGKTDRQKLLRSFKSSQSNGESKEGTFNYNDVPKELLAKANALYPTIASAIGLADISHLRMSSNFYEIGGNSLNSVYTVLKLRDHGYQIGITEFITAKSIEEVLLKMEKAEDVDEDKDAIDPEENKLEMLNDSHKSDIIEMITESFFTKADLERWLIPAIKKGDYFDLMQDLWPPLVEKNLSFILRRASDNKIISVALNFDARDEPEIEVRSKLGIIFDFLEYLEAPVREERLPKGKNQIFHTFMMATHNELNAAENVILMRLMEQKCLEIATKRKFAGILTTNTSPLTQQLGTDVFNYDVMLDYQVNNYVAADSTKPFGEAPDDQRAVVSWKAIHYE